MTYKQKREVFSMKKLFSMFLILCLMAVLCAVATAEVPIFAGGAGTEDDP